MKLTLEARVKNLEKRVKALEEKVFEHEAELTKLRMDAVNHDIRLRALEKKVLDG